MNLKTISRNVGYALLVSALFMLFSVFVSIANGNDSALVALLISFFITSFPPDTSRRAGPVSAAPVRRTILHITISKRIVWKV